MDGACLHFIALNGQAQSATLLQPLPVMGVWFTIPTTQESHAHEQLCSQVPCSASGSPRCEITGVELGISTCITTSIKLPSTEAALPLGPLAECRGGSISTPLTLDDHCQPFLFVSA